MKRWVRAITTGAIALGPVAALAAIDGSHHDMKTYLAAGGNVEKCAYCHSKVLATAATAERYGQVGTFCVVVCHDGTVSAAAIPTSSGYWDGTGTIAGIQSAPAVVAFTKSHGSTPATLQGLDPDNTDGLAGSGWPHTSATAEMECTSCHTVHDATNTPFLNAKLGGVATLGTDFCSVCHNGGDATTQGTAGRYQAIAERGAHPVEFAFSQLGTAGPTAEGGTAPAGAMSPKQTRAISLKSPIFYQWPSGTGGAYVDKASFNAVGNHWNTGGHFVSTADGYPANVTSTATADTQQFGCYTCHSAHQAPTTAFQGSNYLILAPQKTATSSLYCEGCHGAGATPGPNPGATTFFHPADTGTGATDSGTTPPTYSHSHAGADHTAPHTTDPNIPNTGTFTFPVAMDSVAIGATRQGDLGEVICISCHDVHGGQFGYMAIRTVDAAVQVPGATMSKTVCLACHKASANPQAANAHHPGKAIGTYGSTYGFGNPSWTAVTGSTGMGDLTDGLSCPDCHVFNGTAHNW